MNRWYCLEPTEVLHRLEAHAQSGLSIVEARDRLAKYGRNTLREQPPKSPWLMLWEQFTATTVLVLIVAAVLSAILGDLKDAAAIMAIVIFNGLLGFTQEYQAGKEFAALKQMAVPKARVCREGEWQAIVASELVPGDIIQLEDGVQVPADARLLECTSLRTQESAFTGEPISIAKSIEPIGRKVLPLGDQRNMVFMGTIVTYGRAIAVITATGMHTELGQIASSIQSVKQTQTPLQRRLDQLGRKLAVMALLLVAIIFVFGLVRGENIQSMFLTAVSLAVAIIPEGLPAIVTIALALGSRRMLKRHALIRKLPAVETLGSVTTICSDKTGTLTENRMTVTILSLAGQRVDLRATFAEITSQLNGHKSILRPGQGELIPPPMAITLIGSALCNNALVSERTDQSAPTNRPDSDVPKAIGDPTEIALVIAADRLGLIKRELEARLPRAAEAPFDSERKRMTTIHRITPEPAAGQYDSPASQLLLQLGESSSAAYIAFTKGSVDGLLQICRQVWVEDRPEPLTSDWAQRIGAGNDQLASSGTRVLGVAFRPIDTLPPPGREASVEQDLIFAGLVGMLDPARPEAKAAIQACNQAGIRTVMITGDHPLMARHIDQELGISHNGNYLTGQDVEQLSLTELEQQVEDISVYARVSSQQKLMIVDALKNRGHIVSMTGDGVNDAPALRKADIGVAMGITGTDVAKEAADMVLLDDNFATIIAAIEEGRVIYDNIRKFIRYSLTGNTSGVAIMLLAPLLAMPLPLEPTQILWINLLADGLLALALSVEPAESNVMRRPPYPPNESVFSRGVGRDIVWVGLLMGIVFLLAGYYLWTHSWANWQTWIFSTLAFSRMSLALAMRSERDFSLGKRFFGNPAMLGAVLLTLVLQMAVIYIPWLQVVFETSALSNQELLISLAISTIGFWAVGFEKLFFRLRHQ